VRGEFLGGASSRQQGGKPEAYWPRDRASFDERSGDRSRGRERWTGGINQDEVARGEERCLLD